MIPILIVAALLQSAVPEPTPAPESDIVVMAERMRRIRVVTRKDRRTGENRCIVRRSSGLPALDDAICEAALACAGTETEREGMEACLGQRMPVIAKLFARSDAGIKARDAAGK